MIKTISVWVLALVSLSGLAGCGPKQATAPPASPAATNVVVGHPLGSVKKGDQAVCVLCNKNGGTTEPEPVAETLDYKGKTYAFCNESEKAEFISDPSKYVQVM